MRDTVMFLVFVVVGIMCDVLNRKTREGKVVMIAYCLLTACALTVVIFAGNGFGLNGQGTTAEAALTVFKP